MIPQIVVRPEKRYDSRGRYKRGARRRDGTQGRTLALLDTIGVTHRPHQIWLQLSRSTKMKLAERAAELRVSQTGLAAYLVEKALRGDR